MGDTEEFHKPKLDRGTRRLGGFRTLPFIIANETFEKVANFGLHANMILYLISEYHMTPAKGTSVVFLWSAVSNFMPTLGAFLSDAYFGRFHVIVASTFIILLGIASLWLTTILGQLRPPRCDPGGGVTCEGPNAAQLLFLLMSFGLMSIGAGGIRACSMPFGADQIAKPGDPKNERTLQSYFNWYYASVGASIMLAITVIVYIQQEAGWVVGFGIPVGLTFLATIFFLLGSNTYVKVRPNKSLFTSLAQVVVVVWKNRHLPLPPKDSDASYYHHKGSKIISPTKRLRYLNKACMIRNPEKELDSNGLAIDPWSLCTVKQVEELKAVAKVVPIWSSGIVIAVTISQQTFPVLQAKTMDRHLTYSSSFQIPASSFGVFAILTLTVSLALYDRLLIPIIAKRKGDTGLSLLKRQRMGIGLIISCAATAVAAVVERRRRGTAEREGLLDKPEAVVGMSAMWLVPQYCIIGLAEAFNAIGQIEFYYSQFPKSMSSIAVAMLALGMAVGALVGTAIVNVLDGATKRGGKESWVGDNLNRSRYDYYYWLLTLMSVVNVFYYFFCSWAYGSVDEDSKVWDLWEEDEEGYGVHDGEVLGSMASPVVISRS